MNEQDAQAQARQSAYDALQAEETGTMEVAYRTVERNHATAARQLREAVGSLRAIMPGVDSANAARARRLLAADGRASADVGGFLSAVDQWVTLRAGHAMTVGETAAVMAAPAPPGHPTTRSAESRRSEALRRPINSSLPGKAG